jgi:hypothetical protein
MIAYHVVYCLKFSRACGAHLNFYTFTLLASFCKYLHFYAFTLKTRNFYATLTLCLQACRGHAAGRGGAKGAWGALGALGALGARNSQNSKTVV